MICGVANSQAAPGENKGNNLPISILVRLVSKLLGALYILCAQDFLQGERDQSASLMCMARVPFWCDGVV